MANNIRKNSGMYVPTTNVLAIQNLRDPEDVSLPLKNVLIDLYQDLNNMNLTLNLKDGGYITPTEFINGPILFLNPQQKSQTFNCLVVCGALPNAGTISVPHNITVTNTFMFFGISGGATNPISRQFIPMPYSSPTLNQNISVTVDATYVNITTAIDYSAYTNTLIILEYIKS